MVTVPGPGRSVYLCPNGTCLEAAVRRRALAHTLKEPTTADDVTVAQFTAACEERKVVR